MTVPALSIPVRADLGQFKKDMNETSSLVRGATLSATKHIIAMNAGWLASQGAAGGAALAMGRVLGVLGPIALGVAIITDGFKLLAYSTELAKQRIEEYNGIVEKANSTGVSADFFQRFTKSGAAARLSIDEVTTALKRFNEVSTDKLGGSDLQQRLDQLTKAGNFSGNPGTGALASATTSEEKLRAVVKLIDDAMTKGERLAALDIAGKAFGEPVAAALRANSGHLDHMLRQADAMSQAKLISPEDLGRAIELKDRMEAAQKILSDKWKPVQDDLATLGMNYHRNWVSITETLADAVGYATQLYSALSKVPSWFSDKVGNASVWKDLTDLTTTPESRKAAEDAHGVTSDPTVMAQTVAYDKLRAAMQNYANQTRQMRQASDIVSAVRGDKSKNPTTAKEADSNDQFDRASEAIEKHTSRLAADTKAVGLGAAALQQFRAEASLTTAAQQAGLPTTQALTDRIKALAAGAGEAAEALAKARVASEIKVDRATAFMSAEDVAIARQLASVYGDDVPRALASSEAAAMRMNNALRDFSVAGRQELTGFVSDFRSQMMAGTSAWDSFGKAGLNTLNSLADRLTKMASDKLWDAAFGGKGGGSGLFSSLFNFGGGTGIGETSAVAGASSGMMGGVSFPMLNHTGYGPGDPSGPRRSVPSTVFNNAPRFHSGIGPGERAAIIRNNESVLTPGQMGQLAPAGAAASAAPQAVHVTVSVDMDADGKWQGHVKNVSQSVSQAAVKNFATSPSFVDHVGAASRKATARRL